MVEGPQTNKNHNSYSVFGGSILGGLNLQWVGLALVIFLGLVGQLLIKTVLGRLLGKLLGGEVEIQRKLIGAVGLAVAGFVWSRQNKVQAVS